VKLSKSKVGQEGARCMLMLETCAGIEARSAADG
jgi:hypothetical protein